MPITKDQARVIAKAFLEISHELGVFRFANWSQLTPTERRNIEDAEWDTLNSSNSFVTTAVGIALQDMQQDLKAITDATAKAKEAISTIETVKDVIKVATAIIVLGGAIASQNPAAIAGAANDAFRVAQDAINKHTG